MNDICATIGILFGSVYIGLFAHAGSEINLSIGLAAYGMGLLFGMRTTK